MIIDGDSNDDGDSTYDHDDDLMMMIMMMTIVMIRAFTTKTSRYNSCGSCGRKRHLYIYIDDKLLRLHYDPQHLQVSLEHKSYVQ